MAEKSKKMKQVMDIAEQLKIAEDNAEDSGEGDYSKIIPPKNGAAPAQETKNEVVEKTEEAEPKKEVEVQESKPVQEEVVTTKFVTKTESMKQENKPVEKPRQEVVTKEYIKKIIDITEIYKSCTDSVKSVIKKFVNAESDEIEEVVYKTLTTNREEVTALIDLVDLKKEDGTSRAFSLMSYDDNKIMQVSNLLLKFNHEYEAVNTNDKIEFCRNLEKGIDTLKQESLEYLSPVRDLLILAI